MANKIKEGKSWLEKMPWLSLLILFITYMLFGWSITQKSESLIKVLLNTGENLNLLIEKDTILLAIHLLALATIIIITFFLTTPIALITFVYKGTISSDLTAIISVFGWSLLLVIIACYFSFFADFLVMISASILARLDLQKLGCKSRETFLIILILASIAFALGVFSFQIKNSFIIDNIIV
jgi:hypothetical protein